MYGAITIAISLVRWQTGWMIMSIISAGVNVNAIELYLKHSAQILWLESMQKVSSIEVRQA
jgi:hypothetical protein